MTWTVDKSPNGSLVVNGYTYTIPVTHLLETPRCRECADKLYFSVGSTGVGEIYDAMEAKGWVKMANTITVYVGEQGTETKFRAGTIEEAREKLADLAEESFQFRPMLYSSERLFVGNTPTDFTIVTKEISLDSVDSLRPREDAFGKRIAYSVVVVPSESNPYKEYKVGIDRDGVAFSCQCPSYIFSNYITGSCKHIEKTNRANNK